jgi:hypothetical protein
MYAPFSYTGLVLYLIGNAWLFFSFIFTGYILNRTQETGKYKQKKAFYFSCCFLQVVVL